jgi:hypothetical protein
MVFKFSLRSIEILHAQTWKLGFLPTQSSYLLGWPLTFFLQHSTLDWASPILGLKIFLDAYATNPYIQ